MSIKPICNKCKKELNMFSGIILSPTNENNKVKKYHLYDECYKEIEEYVRKKEM